MVPAHQSPHPLCQAFQSTYHITFVQLQAQLLEVESEARRVSELQGLQPDVERGRFQSRAVHQDTLPMPSAMSRRP